MKILIIFGIFFNFVRAEDPVLDLIRQDLWINGIVKEVPEEIPADYPEELLKIMAEIYSE